MNETIKEFYMNEYPNDELGIEMNGGATWKSLIRAVKCGIVYEFLGVHDSIVRERVFQEWCNMEGCDYDIIYNLWIYGAE